MRFAGFLVSAVLVGCSGIGLDEARFATTACAEVSGAASMLANPCAGKPDGTDMGCATGTNRDGNQVSGVAFCRDGKVVVRPCSWSGEQCQVPAAGGGGECRGPACNQNGYTAWCDGNVIVSCGNNGTIEHNDCGLLAGFCGFNAANGTVECATSVSCVPGAHAPFCLGGTVGISTCGANGWTGLFQCPGLTECREPPSGCYPKWPTAGGPCLIGGLSPTPGTCVDGKPYNCDPTQDINNGTWVAGQACGAGTVCAVSSQGVAWCRPTGPVCTETALVGR